MAEYDGTASYSYSNSSYPQHAHAAVDPAYPASSAFANTSVYADTSAYADASGYADAHAEESNDTEEEINLCPHWCIMHSSNTHAARDRGWFTDYTIFKSYMNFSGAASGNVEVEGIGTVSLKLKQSPTSDGVTVLRLTDVLHVPSLSCNIFCPQLCRGQVKVQRWFDSATVKGWVLNTWDERVGYLPADEFPDQLQLSGPPVGPRTINIDGRMREQDINWQWPAQEQLAWTRYKQALEANCGPVDPCLFRWFGQQPPLINEEMMWIVSVCGSLDGFYKAHGLRMNSEGDYEYSRALVRGLMHGVAARDVVVPPSFRETSSSATFH